MIKLGIYLTGVGIIQVIGYCVEIIVVLDLLVLGTGSIRRGCGNIFSLNKKEVASNSHNSNDCDYKYWCKSFLIVLHIIQSVLAIHLGLPFQLFRLQSALPQLSF